jgi:ubiquinone/menaquinone biosynthesis C-methylase UbiE
MENKGQDTNVWTNEWVGLTPISEIQMWDYYGGRQWISKYVPRFGKVLEAGCGLGRYVFYFSKFGIDIEGVDFSSEVIDNLNIWQKKHGFDCNFVKGDVTNLPYLPDSISGYISLGVVEHFIDGPGIVLKETLRVLKPGGIAIITTPSRSFWVRYNNFKRDLKIIIKKLIGKKIINPDFFQYEYTAKDLKRFLSKEGFYVSRAENCDLLYPFLEISKFTGNNIYKDSFAVKFAGMFENTFLKKLGAQSITISVKTASVMHCFLCDELKCGMETLEKYDVPVCCKCEDKEVAKNYLRNNEVKYSSKYSISPEYDGLNEKTCDLSGKEYISDELFENFGFNKNVHPDLLSNPEINIELCCNNIQPIWRMKK